MKFPSQLTCHRLCGLDTLTTKTSAKGSGARTPEIKSSMRSAGDSLFLPRLTASTAPSRRAARSDGLPKKFVIRARIREKTEELHQHDMGGPYYMLSEVRSQCGHKWGPKIVHVRSECGHKCPNLPNSPIQSADT